MSRGRILPRLQPPRWADADAVLCEPLIGDDPRWNAAVWLPYVAYGVDQGDTFGFFDPAADLAVMRSAARSGLVGLDYDLSLLDYDTFRVIEVHGHEYASEVVLDPAFMRQLEQRLQTGMLAVGIPCRGHAYVTAGMQDEDALRRFVDLVAAQHASAKQPLFGLPVLVQGGDAVGILRLADEDESGGEALLLSPESD
ncbi:MAG: hypothetical protein AAGA54_23090 [Myxococcota bacterium]